MLDLLPLMSLPQGGGSSGCPDILLCAATCLLLTYVQASCSCNLLPSNQLTTSPMRMLQAAKWCHWRPQLALC